MIAIDNILVSDEIIHEQFVCDLHKCKGGCCVDGDAGAPLAKEELEKKLKIFRVLFWVGLLALVLTAIIYWFTRPKEE